jgi:curved DNA-binding protein CbpA
MTGQLDFIYDSETFIDLYAILEIEMDVKIDKIKIAYIKMAKKNHPDQGGSSEKFQEITRAYEILYNKELRKEYDLYYLKKSMDEFNVDDYIRLKDDFKNFMTSSDKPITKEELEKLYEDTFNEERIQNKDSPIDTDDIKDRINDLQVERENMLIESSDDTLTNFITQHKDQVNINEVFDFFKYKNYQSFSNSIIEKEWGTLDTIPGYNNGYSSFMDDNEYFGSNLYSNITDMNTTLSSESTSNLNIEEFMQWKASKRINTKLSDSDIDYYLNKRELEQEKIFKEVETNLSSNSKVKEVEKFLKKNHLKENINEYNNFLSNHNDEKLVKPLIKKSNVPEIIDLDLIDSNLDLIDSNLDLIDSNLDLIDSNLDLVDTSFNNNNSLNDNTTLNKNLSDINGMLKFMDEINLTNTQDFVELEKEIGIEKLEKKEKKDNFIELKSGIIPPKANNVRKRDIV